MPAPATTTMREGVRARAPESGSDGSVAQGAFRRSRCIGRQSWVVAVERGAIWADEFTIVAHVAEYMRMIERGLGAYTHKFPGTDLDDRNARVVVEMGNDCVGHDRHDPNAGGTIAAQPADS